jgi:hypothetical protein
MTSRGELVKVVSMRLSADDDKLLRSVAAQVPVIPPLTLARVAMRIGLEIIQKDPARAIEGSAKRRK